MALPVVSTNMTTISLCDVITGWTGDGPVVSTGTHRQGSACIATTLETGAGTFTFTPAASIDLTDRGAYFWYQSVLSMDTKANGGIQLTLNSTGASSTWNVAGNDTIPSQGWTPFCVDVNVTPDSTTGGGVNLSAVTSLGYVYTSINVVDVVEPNTFIDACRHGTKISIKGGGELAWDTGTGALPLVGETVTNATQTGTGIIVKVTGTVTAGTMTIRAKTGAFADNNSISTPTLTSALVNSPTGVSLGVPATFQDILDHENLSAQQNGIGYVWDQILLGQGIIEIGSATAGEVTVFDDDTRIVKYRDDSIVLDGYHKLVIIGETYCELGDEVGTGNSSTGVKGGTFSAKTNNFDIDASSDDLKRVDFLGTIIDGANSLLWTNTNDRLISGTISGSKKITLGLGAELRGSVITGSIEGATSAALELVSKPTNPEFRDNTFINNTNAILIRHARIFRALQVDDTPTGTAFVDQTTAAGDATAADWTLFPATEAVGDFAAFAFGHKFNKLTFDYLGGTAGVGGVVVWEFLNGATWTALTGVTDNTTSFTATAADGVTVTWTEPTTWNTGSVDGSPQLYWVRARITTVYTTNPVMDQGFVSEATAPVYDLRNIKFSGNTKKLRIEAPSGQAITINTLEGGDSLLAADLDLAGGITSGDVTIVNSPVTTTINVDDNTGADLQNARVLFEASDTTGDLPFMDNISITRSASTATVTHTAHGFATNDKVTIRGANQPEYNGVFPITVTTANAYTYTVSGTPATPATGNRVRTAQTHSNYDNVPAAEGTFSGGSGHAATDVLTLDKNVSVTVDAVSAGVVTQFTIDSRDSRGGVSANDTLNQTATTGSGTGFSLTPDTANLTPSATGVIVEGLTDVNGQVTATKAFSTNQPGRGYIRLSTTSPRFKTFNLAGNVVNSSSGLTITVRMILDE